MGLKAALVGVALAVGTGGCAQTTTPSVQQDLATDEIFKGTKPEVIRLAIKAIQSKGWKLDQVNESVGIVSFETSMSLGSWSGITANLILEEAGPNLYRVTGTAKQNLRGNQTAAFDIGGESLSIVREAIAAMHAVQQPKS